MTSEIKPEDVKLPEPYLKPEFGRQALFTADQVRAAVLEAKAQERERCARVFEATADQVWAAAMEIPAPSDKAGALAHVSVVLRERAAAIRSGR